MESRIRLWREGDISDEDLALEMDYMVPELKRCYEELDFLKANVLTDDDHWIATCKPDGEGQCTMMIEGYEELMRLDKEGKIEIPEYSHGYDELLLYECECGVTHDEWLESKN
tara:strand:- start:77 stop:415 length:339 start_codon:yes stop_codon:yes gene_type:complete